MTLEQLNTLKQYLLMHKIQGYSANEINTMVQWLEAEIQAKTDA